MLNVIVKREGQVLNVGSFSSVTEITANDFYDANDKGILYSYGESGDKKYHDIDVVEVQRSNEKIKKYLMCNLFQKTPYMMAMVPDENHIKGSFFVNNEPMVIDLCAGDSAVVTDGNGNIVMEIAA